jgi:protein-disulfide isomerase-like protein with CxxC motif
MEQETINEFALAQRWKINGFPSCVVQLADGKAIPISNGYLSFEEIEKRIAPYLD